MKMPGWLLPFTNGTWKMARHLKVGALLLFVLLAVWLPRGLQLDRFVTPDEPEWLARSANFYQALYTRNFADTFQREHPGVTITWAGTAGFLWRFSDYVKIGSVQVERPAKLQIFLRNHVREPMDLLEAGRTFVVLGITFVLGLAFLYAVRLLGPFPALLSILLISFDPFFVAHSRLLHLDGAMTALVFLSVLAYLNFSFKGGRSIDLIVSGAAAGLSWLTKSPALVLIPILGFLAALMTGWEWYVQRRIDMQAGLLVVKRHIIWTAAGVFVFVLLWPAVWVAPLETISRIFSQASIYVAEGHDSATFFNGLVYPAGESAWYFYPVSYLWRATPVVLAGLFLLLAAALSGKRIAIPADHRKTALVLVYFSIVFMAFMTLGAKKFDRYLLPVFPALDLLAALGWFAVIRAIWERVQKYRLPVQSYLAVLLFCSVAIVQLLGVVQTFPYYLNYYNPLLGGSSRAADVMMIGWGEGLDAAARYLNSLRGAKHLRVLSWYGEGPFSYIFNGLTMDMDMDITSADLKRADYAVVYISQVQRGLLNPAVLDYLKDLKPVQTIWVGDIPYAQIYQLGAD